VPTDSKILLIERARNWFPVTGASSPSTTIFGIYRHWWVLFRVCSPPAHTACGWFWLPQDRRCSPWRASWRRMTSAGRGQLYGVSGAQTPLPRLMSGLPAR